MVGWERFMVCLSDFRILLPEVAAPSPAAPRIGSHRGISRAGSILLILSGAAALQGAVLVHGGAPGILASGFVKQILNDLKGFLRFGIMYRKNCHTAGIGIVRIQL